MASATIKANQSEASLRFYAEMEKLFTSSRLSGIEKLQNFCKYVPIVDIGRFLAKHMIFQEILHVPGHIIECGVYQGGGLMAWGQLSAIFEPLNHVRRIVGFDSFAGFPSVVSQDRGSGHALADQTDFSAAAAYEDLKRSISLYDLYRPLGHIPRVELVVGDATQTIPEFIQKTSHLIVSMLYLDFDLYQPTKLAIESFLPRMPKGAIIAFDELVHAAWPGETVALADSLGVRNVRLRRFAWQPQICYAVLT